MNQLNKINKISAVLVTAVFIFLLLPAVFANGMFLDGIVYATVSRNLAEGNGSFWHLHYTSTLYPVFYEHPPLSFYIQSLFFNILGDHPWIERIYSFLAALINILLIIQIWYALFKNSDKKYFWWVPVLFFIITPVVFWSFTNNMIENTLSVFTLSSFVLIIFATNTKGKKALFYGIFAGILTAAAFLTKGFVGLFPLVFPLLIGLFKYNIRPKRIINNSITMITTVVVIIGLILLFNPAAYDFFKNYFDVQVLKSINGGREITQEGRFYLITRLFSELLPMLGIALLLFVVKLKKNIRFFREDRRNRKFMFLFFCTGLCGSLPLLISPKQHGYYLVPSLPFFALAIGIIAFPIIYRVFKYKEINLSVIKSMKIIAYFLLVASLVFSVMHIGKYHRDEALLKDIRKIKTIIPENTTVSIPKELFEEWTLRAYMMRNAKISLDCDNNDLQYFVVENGKSCKIPNKYHQLDLKLETIGLYEK
jgi:4-amino-4-deoxy-L-arabinose transferase-like glycosyltransferase